jgi:hypothetical protein
VSCYGSPCINKMERFANRTGTGITLTRDAVRDSSTPFALLTSVGMTDRSPVIEVISGRPHSSVLYEIT